MSNYTKAKQVITHVRCAKNIFLAFDKLCSGNPQMTNLRTDEIVFFRNLTKIGTDENKAIYSINVMQINLVHYLSLLRIFLLKILSSA